MSRKKLAELLNARSVEDQVATVEKLLAAVNAPVLDVIVRYDSATNNTEVMVIGGNPTFGQLRHILNEANGVVQQAEVEAGVKKVIEETPPPEPEVKSP